MPDWKALVRARVGPLPVDPAREAEIIDELAQHAAEHCADLIASGVPERDAIAQALAPLEDRQRVAAEIARADRPRASAPAPAAHGCRRGGGREEHRPRQAGAAGDLRALHAAAVFLAALEQLRPADPRRSAILCAHRPAGADDGRSAAADLPGGRARRGDLAVGRGAALPYGADRSVRRAGAGALLGRRLRDDRLLGGR